MFTRHRILRCAIATGIVVGTLSACGMMKSSKMEFYDATLSGGQEVPPVNSTAVGSAEVQLNKETNVINWKLTYSGLAGPATGAHIHGPAPSGQNAGVLIPFTAIQAQPVFGQATITAQQAGDLAAGLWYVNVHSSVDPNGEIRGQLRLRQ